jgi:hypothetical protein
MAASKSSSAWAQAKPIGIAAKTSSNANQIER